MVAVAQLVERRSVAADVAGSSPVSHPIEKIAFWAVFLSLIVNAKYLH